MEYRAIARRGVALAAAAVLILAAAPAAAQDSLVPQVALGVAAGIATPSNGDFDFTATSWQADVRFETTRHLGFNVFVEEWRHTNKEMFTSQTITSPGGTAGRVDRVTTQTRHRTRVVGWNVLGRLNAGRVTLSGGGGVSYLLYSRQFNQAMTGCLRPPAAISPGSSTTAASPRSFRPASSFQSRRTWPRWDSSDRSSPFRTPAAATRRSWAASGSCSDLPRPAGRWPTVHRFRHSSAREPATWPDPARHRRQRRRTYCRFVLRNWSTTGQDSCAAFRFAPPAPPCANMNPCPAPS
jgi:hypothetical protein